MDRVPLVFAAVMMVSDGSGAKNDRFYRF